MTIKIENSFSKDIKKLNNSELNRKIYSLIQELKSYNDLANLKNIKKVKK